MIKIPVKKYLETLVGISKDEAIRMLRGKFRFSKSEALEIYKEWRSEYIKPSYIYSICVNGEITDEKSFVEMVVNTVNYPVTKKQVKSILNLKREGKAEEWIAKNVKLSYERVSRIVNKAERNEVL